MTKQDAEKTMDKIIKLAQQLPPNRFVEERTAKVLDKLYEEVLRASRAISTDGKLQ